MSFGSPGQLEHQSTSYGDFGESPIMLGQGNSGLTARSDRAGFSPIRGNKGREHNLDVDPRTKLPIINVPSEYRVKFADLTDVVIHVFALVYKTTKDDQKGRVFIVTDRSVLVCSKEGAVSRCFMVDRIKELMVCADSKALAIKVPTECDLIIKFGSSEARNQTIRVLRQVYRHQMRKKLDVEQITGQKFDPSSFMLKKPQNFRPILIPQQTREDLRRSIAEFEAEEEALFEELDQYQEEMEAKHDTNMTEMHSTVQESVQKLREAVKEVWDNEAKLNKLREDVAKGRRLIEQVDGPFGADGDLPVSKDAQIAELELIVNRLNASVLSAGTEEAGRRVAGQGNESTFFGKDDEADLYQPQWPGEGDGLVSGDVSSICRNLQQKIIRVTEEATQAADVLRRGEETELRLQSIEERIAQLRHQQRTGGGKQVNVKAGGLVGVNASPRGGGSVLQQASEDQRHDQLYGWMQDLPADLSVETLTVDPRTGLHFVTIPPTMSAFFVDAQDAVLHYFGIVRKPSKVGEKVRRVLLISDQALYLCTINGTVKRCIDVIDVDEILLDSSCGIGFRSENDVDMMFTCASADHRQEVVDILQRLHKFATGGRAIHVSSVPTHKRMEGFLNLNLPEGYVLKMTQFRTRQELVNALRDRRDTVLKNAPVQSGTAQKPSDVNMTEEVYLQLRADVARQLEYEWRQDASLVQLRQQLDSLSAELRGTEEESHELKTAIDNHRCESGVGLNAGSFPLAPGSGVVPTTGPGTYRPNADGLFFISVDPVQLNCELDILKLTFNRDYLFTGHSNGFVNIWDLQQSKDHTLLRSLRDHTGRITDLKVTQNDLLSASTDGSIRRWELSNAKCVYSLHGHQGPVNCIDASNERMISGGHDTMVTLWNLERGQAVNTLQGHHSSVVDLRFEGDMLVSAEWGWILFWDLRSGKVVRSLRDEQGGIKCLDYKEGIAVAGGTGGDLTVWDISTGGGETINAHTDDILDVQLSGKSCITSGGDYKIKMWDLAGMKSLGVFHESHPFETRSFRMEGRRMIAAQGQFAKIWTK